MVRLIKYFFRTTIIFSLFFIVWETNAKLESYLSDITRKSHSLPPDTIRYAPKTDPLNPYDDGDTKSGLLLKDPENLEDEIIYDPENDEYIVQKKAGNLNIGSPKVMSFQEYQEYQRQKQLREYWDQKIKGADGGDDRTIPKLHVPGKAFERIFGSNTIDIRPQGSVELRFGVLHNFVDNPQFDVKQRRNTDFDFQMPIQMNVLARIGDKIEFRTTYNTEASFEFENKMKLAYEGNEDEIIQSIEMGDVSMPLTGSLITGSQSLFGIKTKLRFGRTTITSVFSQQRSESKTIEVSGGAQSTHYKIKANEYEENRHFFLSQYFRKNYNEALSELPLIKSNINITKIEVWVTNKGAPLQDNRNVVAFQDIGESDLDIYNNQFTPNYTNPDRYFPQNGSNTLYMQMQTPQVKDITTVSQYLRSQSLVAGIDYETVESAKKLSSSEYKFNSKLGFISLNTPLNADQVLAVAYQYTVVGKDSAFQVGEFTDEINPPSTLVLKLLKSTATNTQIPLWNLMMKNVYSLDGYQINPEDFRLNILYYSNKEGVLNGYLTEGHEDMIGEPLIRILGLDKLNTLMERQPDGIFDFIDNAAGNGGTIESSSGRVYFPVLEPFGDALREAITGGSGDPDLNDIADKYCFDSLYSMTKYGAEQYPEKNKFYLEGTYKASAGSDISLNAMNVPEGSVVVTAGGRQLVENVDYTVDYTLGRVKIINEGILNSGTPIQITHESNSLFNIQQKTLMGTHVDYEVNKNLLLGATVLNLTERPLTQKVNMGNEPISNTIWGTNLSYNNESRFITRMVDKLPLINTKAPSRLTLDAEFAHFVPGHSKAIGQTGTAYIDDFEGSASSIDLTNINSWILSSTPQDMNLFPEAGTGTGYEYNYNRAKLAWYKIDPLFYRDNNLTPSHIKKDADQLSNHYVREVKEKEVFPNKELPSSVPTNIPIFNMVFYPTERGPYNYNYNELNQNGLLINPQNRWGGIMRSMTTTDFESTNIEYIEFWLMDPYTDPDGDGPKSPLQSEGSLYINLGDISEDILRDGRKSFENGLPVNEEIINVDTTIWGRVPSLQSLVDAFDNNTESRIFQDVGLDGLRDEDEITFFRTTSDFLIRIDSLFNAGAISEGAYQAILSDPSADNYHYYRGSDFDDASTSILNRYKNYNNMDGNSPTDAQSPENYSTSATNLPNIEDINKDNTLNENERYFQYEIDFKPNMQIGENYITDIYEANVSLENGNTSTVRWLQFKVPVKTNDKQVVGNIQDFKSIRFMRMFMKGFSEMTVLRFATLELVRGEWRKYDQELIQSGEGIIPDPGNISFDVSVVNIEENGKRYPVPYVIPPGIEREINIGTTNNQKLNEQALSFKVCNLPDGVAKAVYKTTEFDFRNYGKLRMYAHAEAAKQENPLNAGDLTVFIRLGTDFDQNYYEYEIPLTPTPWGTSETDEYGIWPEQNELDLELHKLTEVKLARNTAVRQNSSITLNSEFTVKDGKNTITVKGTPTISDVKVILIGVRNPSVQNAGNNIDNGNDICAEVWVNELRLTDFDESGGWAATGRFTTNLADLGSVMLAGSISTPGFGSIDQTISERQKETITRYDIATDMDLGKFMLPDKTGLKVPVHFDYSETFSNPQYNPLNPDILMKDDLNSYANKADRDSLKKITQSYIQQKSFNLINVRKTRVSNNNQKSNKPHFYDVENLNFTYAYTEETQRNIDVEHFEKKTYKGAVGYNFNNNPKNIQPFAKSSFLSSVKALKLIKDFNFYYAPKLIAFRNELNKHYEEITLRNKSIGNIPITTNYIKTFFWSRSYTVKYDLTKALSVDFNAGADAKIKEPYGKVEKNDPYYEEKMDTVWNSIRELGKLTFYNHQVNVNYKVPIDKLPLLNWITMQTKYTGNYKWTAAMPALPELGHTIENGNSKNVNITGNLVNLYNNVGYLKKLNAPKKRTPRQMQFEPEPEEEDTTKDVNQVSETFKLVGDNILKVMMAVKNVSYSFTENNGKFLPGYMIGPNPDPSFDRGGSLILGQEWSMMAPGTDFIFGGNPFEKRHSEEILARAVANDWLLDSDSLLTNNFVSMFSQSHNFRSTIEPIANLRIELTANMNIGSNWSFVYRIEEDSLYNLPYSKYSPVRSGNFSMTFLSWNTAWVRTNTKDYSNKNFETFSDYRLFIAQKLAFENPNWDGAMMMDTASGKYYPLGYGPTSQEVLIPAFLAAYSGKNWDEVALEPFQKKLNLKKLPMPNWRINYDGLTNIPFIKEYFKKVSIMHSYRSLYNVGGFSSDVRYFEDRGFPAVRNPNNGNFISEYAINQVSISEQFAPLIGFDLTWLNNVSTKIEYRKSRDLALSLVNYQLNEVKGTEYIIGLGYRIPNVKIVIGKTPVENDLILKADLSIKNNTTILRKIIENVNQISSGQKMITINATADYQLNQKVNLRLYFDKTLVNPYVSNQFKRSDTSAGISIRLSLAQ